MALANRTLAGWYTFGLMPNQSRFAKAAFHTVVFLAVMLWNRYTSRKRSISASEHTFAATFLIHFVHGIRTNMMGPMYLLEVIMRTLRMLEIILWMIVMLWIVGIIWIVASSKRRLRHVDITHCVVRQLPCTSMCSLLILCIVNEHG